MPLFQKKFSIPKFPQRKAASMNNLTQLNADLRSTEFGLDYGGVIRTTLSGKSLVFENGNWTVDGLANGTVNGNEIQQSATMSKDLTRFKKEHQVLLEENNLLKLKVDMLLDMLAQSQAEVHLQENEIENLRLQLKKKKTQTK